MEAILGQFLYKRDGWENNDTDELYITEEILRLTALGNLTIQQENETFLIALDLTATIAFGYGKDIYQAFRALSLNMRALNL